MRPRLIAITDTARFGSERTLEALDAWMAQALPGQLAVQLRDRTRSARDRHELGCRLRELSHRHGQPLLINDRIDLALALRADGVHLGEHSMTAAEARQLLGERAWVSCACHDPTRVLSGEFLPADAVVLSPVFAPRKGAPALGLELVAECQARLGAREGGPALVALGGVDVAGAESCAQLGVGVAAIGAIFEVADPAPMLRALGILRRSGGC